MNAPFVGLDVQQFPQSFRDLTVREQHELGPERKRGRIAQARDTSEVPPTASGGDVEA